jgi:hypothetical protein
MYWVVCTDYNCLCHMVVCIVNTYFNIVRNYNTYAIVSTLSGNKK